MSERTFFREGRVLRFAKNGRTFSFSCVFVRTFVVGWAGGNNLKNRNVRRTSIVNDPDTSRYGLEGGMLVRVEQTAVIRGRGAREINRASEVAADRAAKRLLLTGQHKKNQQKSDATTKPRETQKKPIF